MWIRNKGSPQKPNWQLVESRRASGEKHPKQKVICHLGRFNNLDDLIKFWELLARDARTAQRHHISIARRDSKYHLLKKCAPGLSLKEINVKLNKFRQCAERYKFHLQSKKRFEELFRLKRERDFQKLEKNKYRAVYLALCDLAFLVSKTRRDLSVKEWPDYIRKSFKEKIKEMFDFSNTI